MSSRRITALAVAAIVTASMASAASVTINVTSFGVGAGADLAGARAAQASFHAGTKTIVEDFESFTLANQPSGSAKSFTAPAIETKVGTFSSIEPSGTGTTDLTPSNQLHVRNGSGTNGSRFNTTVGGSNYLDSNDNSGMSWLIPGAAGFGAFDKISFLATDIDDVGNTMFNIFAEGGVVDTAFILNGVLGASNVKRPNGELLLFTLGFSELVQNVKVALKIDPGDGFAIDDATISAVPLPAAAWMLLAGVGALAGVGRARRKA